MNDVTGMTMALSSPGGCNVVDCSSRRRNHNCRFDERDLIDKGLGWKNMYVPRRERFTV